jgi:tetratricopeptide (TPR) repeat protein
VYFVMEYLEGVELAAVIEREGAMDVARALGIGTQMCRALAAAHNAGIIHRDLKPENVFLVVREGTTDFVKILDFGIAKSAELEETRKEKLTHPGMAMGTPEYMAPEQAAGKPADARSDVYAVAAIVYEMLTGEPPYQGENFMEILTKKATVEPTPPRQLRPELPEAVERAVMRGLARDTARRPPSMEAFEYDLTKCLAGRGVAVAKILGMQIDPSSMGPMGGVLYDEPSGEPPESVLVTGRVAELGLAGLGAPRLVEDEGDLTEVVQVPKSFSLKAIGIYAAAIAAAAAGISWYAYSSQREGAHTASPIVAVPEPNRPVPEPPPVVERPPVATLPAPAEPAPVAAAPADAAPQLPGRVVVPDRPEIKKGDPQSDLFAHRVERPRLSPERGDAVPRDRTEAEELLDAAAAETTQMEWGRARSLYERVARGKHRRSDGLLGLANVAWQTNDVEAAIVNARRSLDAGGGEAARMMLGHAYLKKGLYDDAIAQYKEVLEANPDSREAQKALREATRKKGGR